MRLQSLTALAVLFATVHCTHGPASNRKSDDTPLNGKADSATPLRTTIRVHYPAETGTIALRGSFGWGNGRAMRRGPNDTWSLELRLSAAINVRPLLDDETPSLGPNYSVTPGEDIDIYPRFTQVGGTYGRAFSWQSTVLQNRHGVWIYLPPTYLENPYARFGVVYMHDGQNLLDPDEAFGYEWSVDEAMDEGANSGEIAEAIIVGIENNASRTSEYTPAEDPEYGGGDADAYLEMITTELKPYIDEHFRTLSDREHTSMVGSSLGGLLSAYAGLRAPETFGTIGAMSPSTWWADEWIVDAIRDMPADARPLRIYLDHGTGGASMDGAAESERLYASYLDAGYIEGWDFMYLVQPGATHSEYYWAHRIPYALAFLLGPGR